MIWFAVRILKLHFQSSNNQYMPSPPALHLYICFSRQLCAGQRQKSQGLLTLCAPSPALAGRNRGAWNFVNRRFLLNALGKVNPSPSWALAEGRLLPVSKTGQSGLVGTTGSSCPSVSLGGHTVATSKQNTQAVWGHFSWKFWMEMWVGGKAMMAPTLTLQVPGHLRVPG